MFSITISAENVSWYGAILSTFLGLLSVYKYFNDKPKIKITYRDDQIIMNEDWTSHLINQYPDKTFFVINVANVGRYKVTISSVGFEYRKRDNKSIGAVISKDLLGPISHIKLEPGSSRDIILDQNFISIKKIKLLYVKDAVGNTYKLRTAPIRYYLRFPLGKQISEVLKLF